MISSLEGASAHRKRRGCISVQEGAFHSRARNAVAAFLAAASQFASFSAVMRDNGAATLIAALATPRGSSTAMAMAARGKKAAEQLICPIPRCGLE